MRVVFAGGVLCIMSLAVMAFDEGDKDKKKDKGAKPPIKKMAFEVTNVRLQGAGNANAVPVNDASKKVLDNDAVDFVFADLVEDDGYVAVEAKFMTFPDENAAKMASLEPPLTAFPMTRVPSSNTWKGMNAPFVKGASGTVTAFNNWIVVWGKFLKGDEFTTYHRLPKKGMSNGFIGEAILK